MSRLPRLKGKEVVRVLGRVGFQVVRTRGSHVFLRHEDGRVTTFQFIPAKFSVPVFSVPSCAMLR